MSDKVQPANRLQAYVRQLTPQARSRLLGELERLHLSGDDIPGSAALLAELRTEFRKGGQVQDRVGDASRYLFQPLEPVLVNAPSAETHDGQISRVCLSAIWDWINQMLLPTMARKSIERGSKLDAVALQSYRASQTGGNTIPKASQSPRASFSTEGRIGRYNMMPPASAMAAT